MDDTTNPSPSEEPRFPRPNGPRPLGGGQVPPQMPPPSGQRAGNPYRAQPSARPPFGSSTPHASTPYGTGPEVWQGNYFVPPNNGKAVAAMVLGIVSIVFSMFWGFGILLGLVAVPLGISALGHAKRLNVGRGMAISGIICGSIGILFSGMMIAAMVWFVTEALDSERTRAAELEVKARERETEPYVEGDWVRLEGLSFHNVNDGLLAINQDIEDFEREMNRLPQSLMEVYSPLPTDPWDRSFILRMQRNTRGIRFAILSQGADVASEADDVWYDAARRKTESGPLQFRDLFESTDPEKNSQPGG